MRILVLLNLRSLLNTFTDFEAINSELADLLYQSRFLRCQCRASVQIFLFFMAFLAGFRVISPNFARKLRVLWLSFKKTRCFLNDG